MKLPRDVSGQQLLKRLHRLGYEFIRQNGSHITVRTEVNGRDTQQIPNHKTIRIGTLENILKDIADHHGMDLTSLLVLLEL